MSYRVARPRACDHRAVDAVTANFRPSVGWRVVGWVMIVFGLVFAIAGVAYLDQDAVGGAFMIGFGVLDVIIMLGIATAVVTADCSGIAYRNVWTRQIPVGDIASIEVRGRAGFAYRRTGIVVTRSSGKQLRLTALDRPNDPPNRARALAQAAEIALATRIKPPPK